VQRVNIPELAELVGNSVTGDISIWKTYAADPRQVYNAIAFAQIYAGEGGERNVGDPDPPDARGQVTFLSDPGRVIPKDTVVFAGIGSEANPKIRFKTLREAVVELSGRVTVRVSALVNGSAGAVLANKIHGIEASDDWSPGPPGEILVTNEKPTRLLDLDPGPQEFSLRVKIEAWNKCADSNPSQFKNIPVQKEALPEEPVEEPNGSYRPAMEVPEYALPDGTDMIRVAIRARRRQSLTAFGEGGFWKVEFARCEKAKGPNRCKLGSS
jgi:hypothetical protein